MINNTIFNASGDFIEFTMKNLDEKLKGSLTNPVNVRTVPFGLRIVTSADDSMGNVLTLDESNTVCYLPELSNTLLVEKTRFINACKMENIEALSFIVRPKDKTMRLETLAGIIKKPRKEELELEYYVEYMPLFSTMYVNEINPKSLSKGLIELKLSPINLFEVGSNYILRGDSEEESLDVLKRALLEKKLEGTVYLTCADNEEGLKVFGIMNKNTLDQSEIELQIVR